MAPEIMEGKGYTFYADIWSIGVMLYEFTTGIVPYGEETLDPYQIYDSIIKDNLEYPDFLKDASTIEYIEILLSKEPEKRLIGGSYTRMRRHIFFQGFDWKKLAEGEL